MAKPQSSWSLMTPMLLFSCFCLLTGDMLFGYDTASFGGILANPVRVLYTACGKTECSWEQLLTFSVRTRALFGSLAPIILRRKPMLLIPFMCPFFRLFHLLASLSAVWWPVRLSKSLAIGACSSLSRSFQSLALSVSLSENQQIMALNFNFIFCS